MHPTNNTTNHPNTTDQIILEGMEFTGFHGCLAEERRDGQTFLVDLNLYLDLSKGGKSDNLSDTIDYSRVYQVVKAIVEGPAHNLIETVAEEIAEKVLAQFPLDRIAVTVHKPYAPLGGPFKNVAVHIERMK